jgi:group I intron endonuclease
MFGYIYKTTNLVNGKIYVGKHASSFFDTTYIGSGKTLCKAIKKYGKKNFDCILIEAVENEADLNLREKYWIAKLNARDKNVGYNINEGGEGNPGYKHTTACRAALSEKKRNYKWYHNGDTYTTIAADGDIPEGFVLGRYPVTEETKEKIATTIKSKRLKAYKSDIDKATIYLSPNDIVPEGYVPGRYIDPDAEIIRREKLRLASTGKTHACSDEQKERNRQAQLGTKCYTDGNTTIKLKPEDSVPEGFLPGKAITDSARKQLAELHEKQKGRPCSDYVKERSRQAHLGVTPANAKKVFCIDTNKLYTSISSASRDTTVPAGYIQKALKNGNKATVKYKGTQYTFEVY